MYENCTSQSLPKAHYRELLGTAITVFNSNNEFIIENVLRISKDDQYSWYDLIDYTSGRLNKRVKEALEEYSQQKDKDISILFLELITMRNRIVHSFQITNSKEEQVLATKEKDGTQFEITEDYLMKFIKKNETFSNRLHQFRGY